MLKTHKEIETNEVIIIDDIICNKCGKSISTVPQNHYGLSFMGSPDIGSMECVTVDKCWGFYSKKDLTRQQIDICEPCWDEFCETLVIPPRETDYSGLDFEQEDDPQLMLFTDEELSGDPELMKT